DADGAKSQLTWLQFIIATGKVPQQLGLRQLAIFESIAVNSTDPNSKVGPTGVGLQEFIAPSNTLPYRVNFENDATATAPAQRVDITDKLDPNLDWNTFQLTVVGFGDNIISIPANSQH